VWAGVLGHIKSEDGEEKVHPTQKPAKLIRWIIEKFTDQDSTIADLFIGSGTTLVACEQTNRIGYGMEICEKYVSVTLERLTGLGLEARLVRENK
jgi:DNA modification methylase